MYFTIKMSVVSLIEHKQRFSPAWTRTYLLDRTSKFNESYLGITSDKNIVHILSEEPRSATTN